MEISSTARRSRTTRFTHHAGLIPWTLSLSIGTLQLTVLILSTLLLISTPGEGNRTTPHRCYVCLPQDKTSSTAQDIITTFPGKRIADCSSFTTHNAHQFQVDCPSDHVGCQLRINGSQISRTCSVHPVNDCKTANSVEFCYCATSLCNLDHPLRKSKHFADDSSLDSNKESRAVFPEGETDDEDFIQSFSHDEGSGDGGQTDDHKHVSVATTSTTDKTSTPHHHGNEDTHLQHNVIPESTGDGEDKQKSVSSNAARLNMNQFLCSILSILICSLVKSKSL